MCVWVRVLAKPRPDLFLSRAFSTCISRLLEAFTVAWPKQQRCDRPLRISLGSSFVFDIFTFALFFVDCQRSVAVLHGLPVSRTCCIPVCCLRAALTFFIVPRAVPHMENYKKKTCTHTHTHTDVMLCFVPFFIAFNTCLSDAALSVSWPQLSPPSSLPPRSPLAELRSRLSGFRRRARGTAPTRNSVLATALTEDKPFCACLCSSFTPFMELPMSTRRTQMCVCVCLCLCACLVCDKELNFFFFSARLCVCVCVPERSCCSFHPPCFISPLPLPPPLTFTTIDVCVLGNSVMNSQNTDLEGRQSKTKRISTCAQGEGALHDVRGAAGVRLLCGFHQHELNDREKGKEVENGDAAQLDSVADTQAVGMSSPLCRN